MCRTTCPCCTMPSTTGATPCWWPPHGEAALQRASQAVPDIILLDAVMPGMDGFEVAQRRLKAQPDTSHIPIVFMTGLAETEHVVAAFQAGGVDYVVKPIRPREVLARIESHMQAAPAVAPGAQCARRVRSRLAHRAPARGARCCGKPLWRASSCSATLTPRGGGAAGAAGLVAAGGVTLSG